MKHTKKVTLILMGSIIFIFLIMWSFVKNMFFPQKVLQVADIEIGGEQYPYIIFFPYTDEEQGILVRYTGIKELTVYYASNEMEANIAFVDYLSKNQISPEDLVNKGVVVKYEQINKNSQNLQLIVE